MQENKPIQSHYQDTSMKGCRIKGMRWATPRLFIINLLEWHFATDHTLLFSAISFIPIQQHPIDSPSPLHHTTPHPVSNMAFLFRALNFLYVSATAGALAGQICASLLRGSFSQRIPIRPGGHHWGKLYSKLTLLEKGLRQRTLTSEDTAKTSAILSSLDCYITEESPHVNQNSAHSFHWISIVFVWW